jgi:hypothetical protein
MYIRILEALGLATVKKVAPTPRFEPAKTMCDYETLHAVIANRYDVLASYATALKRTLHDEVARLQDWSPREAALLKSLKRALVRIGYGAETDEARVAEALKPSKPLQVAVSMRAELMALWDRSHASKEQLLRQLQDWCRRAEASGIVPLVDFSRRLRSYARSGAETKKARASGPFCFGESPVRLLELGLLVEHVLAHLGIVLFDLHLVRRGALVLGRRVEVAGPGGRFELDLVAHQRASFGLAAISASTASTPSLSILRSPAVLTRRRTQRFWLSTQKRR